MWPSLSHPPKASQSSLLLQWSTFLPLLPRAANSAPPPAKQREWRQGNPSPATVARNCSGRCIVHWSQLCISLQLKDELVVQGPLNTVSCSTDIAATFSPLRRLSTEPSFWLILCSQRFCSSGMDTSNTHVGGLSPAALSFQPLMFFPKIFENAQTNYPTENVTPAICQPNYYQSIHLTPSLNKSHPSPILPLEHQNLSCHPPT